MKGDIYLSKEETNDLMLRYLRNFQRNNPPFPNQPIEFKHVPANGKKIVELLKKEGITYDEAYASLQYAYNLIKYESNFLKL